MNKKTGLLLLAVCLLTQVHTQSLELDARGSWIFWPYKLAPNGTVESTLKFVNAGSAARYADSSFFAPFITVAAVLPLTSPAWRIFLMRII